MPPLLVNPTLQDPSIPCIEILQVYGHQVRHAKYYKRQMDRLGKELVSRAWGAIETAHLLDGLPDIDGTFKYRMLVVFIHKTVFF